MKKLGKLKPSIIHDLYAEFIREDIPFNFIRKLNDGKFDEYFSDKNVNYFPGDDIELPELELELFNNQANLSSNAIRLHKPLKILRLEEASDPRLWTYLTLYLYRDYSTKIIKEGKEQERYNENSKQSLIKRDLFYIGKMSVPTYQNTIAKLWWAAEKTYDIDTEEDYKYTKYLLGDKDEKITRSQVYFDISQRKEFYTCQTLIKCYLDFIIDKEKKDNFTGNDISLLYAPLINNHLRSFSLKRASEDEIREFFEEYWGIVKERLEQKKIK